MKPHMKPHMKTKNANTTPPSVPPIIAPIGVSLVVGVVGVVGGGGSKRVFNVWFPHVVGDVLLTTETQLGGLYFVPA